MKILFSPCHYIYDEIQGGSESSWAFNIADRIASKNEESIVVTGFKIIRKTKKYQILEVQPKKKKFDMSIYNALKFHWLNFLATRKLLKNNHFEIFHHVLPFGFGRTFNLTVLINRKLPVIIGPLQSPSTYISDDVDLSDIRSTKPVKHTDYYNKLFKFLLKIPLKYLSLQTLKRAGKIIVVDENTMNLISEYIPAEKIVIIPPGVDTEKFRYIENGKNDKKTVEIITVSYLIKRKMVDLILKAIEEVIKSHKYVRLRIVGDGPQRKRLEELAKEMGIERYVIFEGFITNNDIFRYYQKSHIFVNMSKSEGFATVGLEALSSGLAIISTGVGGFKDVVKDNRNGFIVKMDDYRALANKLNILIENPDILRTFRLKSREIAQKNYDWEKVIIPKYINLYRLLIKTANQHQ